MADEFGARVADLPEDVREPLTALDASLREVEDVLKPLIDARWSDVTRGLPPLEVARMNAMYAYTVNTLFFVYLKAQGIATADHPVRQELERVRTYLTKVRDAAAQAQTSERTSRLNVSAAKRFIEAALNDRPVQGPTEASPAEDASPTQRGGKKSRGQSPTSADRKKKKKRKSDQTPPS